MSTCGIALSGTGQDGRLTLVALLFREGVADFTEAAGARPLWRQALDLYVHGGRCSIYAKAGRARFFRASSASWILTADSGGGDSGIPPAEIASCAADRASRRSPSSSLSWNRFGPLPALRSRCSAARKSPMGAEGPPTRWWWESSTAIPIPISLWRLPALLERSPCSSGM